MSCVHVVFGMSDKNLNKEKLSSYLVIWKRFEAVEEYLLPPLKETLHSISERCKALLVWFFHREIPIEYET